MSRPAAAEELITESAPLCLSRCTFSSSRAAATMSAFGASSRAVSVTSTAASSRSTATIDLLRLLDPGLVQDALLAGAPGDRGVTRGRRREARVVALVDDDDRARIGPVRDQDRGGRAALGAEAADDGVVPQGPPPAGEPIGGPGPVGEDLQRGADEQDQEEDPSRGDDQGRHQARAVGHGPDVAVAGRRDAHGRVVEGVEEADRVVLGIDVPVPPDVGEHGDEDDQRRARAPPGRRSSAGASPRRREARPAGSSPSQLVLSSRSRTSAPATRAGAGASVASRA